jgi:hypothetical protein
MGETTTILLWMDHFPDHFSNLHVYVWPSIQHWHILYSYPE